MIETWVHDGQAAARVEEEALEDLAAPLGVDDLGMELQAEDAPFGVVHGGHRGPGAGGGGHESRRWDRDGVAVAHPDLGRGGPVDAQRGGGGQRQLGAPVLAVPGVRHVPPSCVAMSWAP